ncbi:MAG: DUF86 domain-containing protein [Candidatus Micrarchaeota archaeon]|nr:DUF86 domain-containing protein [Candidatus Micrarchaeota archaeon]
MEEKQRIEKKLGSILDYLEELGQTLPTKAEEYISDTTARNACERLAHKIIESSMDVVAITCKFNKCPANAINDYYLMTEELTKTGFFTKNMGNKLTEFRGFRNILVHGYEKVNDKRAFELMKEIAEFYPEFVEHISKKLNIP